MVHVSPWWGTAHWGGKMLDLVWRCQVWGAAVIFKSECRADLGNAGNLKDELESYTKEIGVLSGNKPWCLTLNARACRGSVHRGKGSETKYAGHLHVDIYLLYPNVSPPPNVCDFTSVTDTGTTVDRLQRPHYWLILKAGGPRSPSLQVDSLPSEPPGKPITGL